MFIATVARFGAEVARRIAEFGVFARFSAATVRALIKGTGSWARWPRIAPQLYLIGTRSVPVLALIGAFIGAILAIEGYVQFRSLGQEHRLGGAISVSVVKQIGPVLAAV
ncbi:MAG TPA: ABC transporter permease, partial [Phycisphaerales bacterium]|nr:ABC transporter permease [Phycisphaerales bacterium]